MPPDWAANIGLPGIDPMSITGSRADAGACPGSSDPADAADRAQWRVLPFRHADQRLPAFRRPRAGSRPFPADSGELSFRSRGRRFSPAVKDCFWATAAGGRRRPAAASLIRLGPRRPTSSARPRDAHCHRRWGSTPISASSWPPTSPFDASPGELDQAGAAVAVAEYPVVVPELVELAEVPADMGSIGRTAKSGAWPGRRLSPLTSSAWMVGMGVCRSSRKSVILG
jgi:hypothetical protein